MKENNINNDNKKVENTPKNDNIEKLKKRKAQAETQKFKSRYFEFYDDIKISDRQDW